jgi:hypothetical protein
MRGSRLLQLAIAAVALALLVASGSRAAEPRIRLAAADGALALSNSQEGAAIFQAEAMRPGEEVAGEVALSNTGTVSGGLSLAPSGITDVAAGIGGGLLSSRLELRVLDVTDAARPVTRYAGPLAAMRSVYVGAMAPGQQRRFRFVATLPRGGSGDNAFQGARLSVGFGWTARAVTVVIATPEPTPIPPSPQPNPVATPEPIPAATPEPAPATPAAPAAAPTPGVAAQPSAGATLGDQVFAMPAATRCVNRFTFKIRVRRPKGVTFKKVTVTVNRRAQVRLSGAKARKLKSLVKLRRLPKGRVTVKVAAVTERGAKLTTTRTYRTCSVKKRKARRR